MGEDFRKWGLPINVVLIVRAVCSDYDRRNNIIKFNTASEEVIAHYREVNGCIDKALEEIEVGIRRDMLNDIILNRGYDFSPISPFLAKNTYYTRKRKTVYSIAKAMHLI